MLSVADDSHWLEGTVLESPPEFRSPVVLDPLTSLHFRLLIGDILKAIPASDSMNLFHLGSRWIVYVDVCGTIRCLDAREKLYIADIDDGTGLISISIWRKDQLAPVDPHNDPRASTELSSFARKLTNLAARTRPAVFNPAGSSDNSNSLQMGDNVQIRGRLNRFRDKITISAHYCRVMSEPQELIDSTIHAFRLREAIYRNPYDPATVANKLQQSSQKNNNKSIIVVIEKILESEDLSTFTQLDLQLHSGVVEAISNTATCLTDEAFYGPDTESVVSNIINDDKENSSKRMSGYELKRRVQELIDALLIKGSIFKAAKPIGGQPAYHPNFGDPCLIHTILKIVAAAQNCSKRMDQLMPRPIITGVSFLLIHERLKWISRYSRISKQALVRVINTLIAESRLYTISIDHFGLA